ncbi:MAG TPA: alpha/beta hydrolase fold domain-containing protein [Acidimicrobiales bacterium]
MSTAASPPPDARDAALDVTELIDPALRAILDSFDMPTIDEEGIATLRGMAFPTLEPAAGVVRTEHLVPGSAPDDPPVPVRVHRDAHAAGSRAAVLTIHGGGYVIGTYDMDGPMLDRWCLELGVVGVSVQYRLAPETAYPGPLDDCYAALRWAHEHAAELGIDPDAIGIYGLSAGGGLAAALALLARDRGEVPLAFQLLDCPMLDDRQTTVSMRARGLRMWKADSNKFGWRSYLGARYGTDDIPPYAAAARATELAELTPSCVVVGSIDGFRDEDVEYAQRLNQAGVPCELHVIAGLPHAYLLAPDAAAVQLAERCKDDWLARQLARLGA